MRVYRLRGCSDFAARNYGQGLRELIFSKVQEPD